MKKQFGPVLFRFLLPLPALFLFTCCTAATSRQPAADIVPLSSIVVLPVQAEIGREAPVQNAEAMSGLLQEHFRGQESFHFISEEELDRVTSQAGGNRAELIRLIGAQMQANGVLILTLDRFIERNGSEYSIVRPASVAFTYRLVQTDNGSTLCSGVFDETQQSLFENIFSLSGQARRGFKWITATDLAREGLKDKLNNCQYLKP